MNAFLFGWYSWRCVTETTNADKRERDKAKILRWIYSNLIRVQFTTEWRAQQTYTHTHTRTTTSKRSVLFAFGRDPLLRYTCSCLCLCHCHTRNTIQITYGFTLNVNICKVKKYYFVSPADLRRLCSSLFYLFLHMLQFVRCFFVVVRLSVVSFAPNGEVLNENRQHVGHLKITIHRVALPLHILSIRRYLWAKFDK